MAHVCTAAYVFFPFLTRGPNPSFRDCPFDTLPIGQQLQLFLSLHGDLYKHSFIFPINKHTLLSCSFFYTKLQTDN